MNALAASTDLFLENSRPFVAWMLGWYQSLQPVSLADLIDDHPLNTGIISVDVIKGFCTLGALSSPRINSIVSPITQLFQDAWTAGVRDIVLTQDAHPEDAVEFGQYLPHCIRGTEEAQTVDAFTKLSFFNQITVIEKNSINAGINTTLDAWLNERPHIKNWIIVGDCTDLCTHQLAMHIRLRANAEQRTGIRVIIPVNTVDTYDMPVARAMEIGAVPHDAELMHLVFLYHMHLNGIEIFTEIAALEG